jgi:hypothetical protein
MVEGFEAGLLAGCLLYLIRIYNVLRVSEWQSRQPPHSPAG